MRESWDTYFIRLAEETAGRSKDPSTKVGAVIVKDNRILSLGYNGAPRLFPDNEVPTGKSDVLFEDKNAYMCHAELNAILNYSGHMSDFKGATIYLTHSPCHECAKALCQIGIKEVIYKEIYHNTKMSFFAEYMLNKCGIKFTKYMEV